MRIERIRTAAMCGSCGRTGRDRVLIQAVDTSPALNTMALCPACLARLYEMLGGFAAAREEDDGK